MKIVVTGASGLLGGWLLHAFRERGDAVLPWCHSHALPGAESIDLTDATNAAFALDRASPDVVVHGAALSAIHDCVADPERAEALNTTVPGELAALCQRRRIRFVHVSTDLVFDGEAAPYAETAPTSPLSVYGRTKADAEARVLEAGGVVVRTSLLYGPTLTERIGFFDQQLAALRQGKPLRLFADEWRTPLALEDAGQALFRLAHADDSGVFHLGGPERMSRLEMGMRLAKAVSAPAAAFAEGRRADAEGEPRPRDVSLDSSRYQDRFPEHRFRTFEEAALAMLTVRPVQ